MRIGANFSDLALILSDHLVLHSAELVACGSVTTFQPKSNGYVIVLEASFLSSSLVPPIPRWIH